MNLETVYQDSTRLSKDCWDNFDRDRNKNLNIAELYGLRHILSAFVKDYESSCYGENFTHIEDVTRFNKDCVDILDGRYDTYIFDRCAIECIWMTNGGAILLDCYDVNSIDPDGFGDVDFTDLPRVLFRLD